MGPTRVPFVILCLGRTGSTHLQSMLDFHSQARCYAEVFNEIDRSPDGFINSDFVDELPYLHHILELPSARAVGLKLPMNSIRSFPGTVDAIRAIEGMRVIRLSRRNLLAQLVSRRLLAKTRVSQSIFGSYGEATVEIDPDEAVTAFAHIRRTETELDEIAEGMPTHRITYEDMVAEQGLNELQRFLELDPEPLRSWYERMRTRPLSETVSNWDELRSGLRGTEFEDMLDEDLS